MPVVIAASTAADMLALFFHRSIPGLELERSWATVAAASRLGRGRCAPRGPRCRCLFRGGSACSIPLLPLQPRWLLGARLPQRCVHGATRVAAAPARRSIPLRLFPAFLCATPGARALWWHALTVFNGFVIVHSARLELRLRWLRRVLQLGRTMRSASPLGSALGSFIVVVAQVGRRAWCASVMFASATSSFSAASTGFPPRGPWDLPHGAAAHTRALWRPSVLRVQRMPTMGTCGLDTLDRQGGDSRHGFGRLSM